MAESSVCPRNSCAGGYGNCLDVKITNYCNGSCAFCIERGGYAPKKQKSAVELALTTVSKADFPNVLILGGEPLMYQHLIEYLKLIRPYKEKIYLTTNGTLLRSPYTNLEDLGKYLNSINISIHHYQEEKNNMVLRGGTLEAPVGRPDISLEFAVLKDSIKVLKDNGCSVRINCNLVKGFVESEHDIVEMVRRAEDLGANNLRFAELQNSPDEFVDAYTIFQGLPEDPYHQGCEVDLKALANKMPGSLHNLMHASVGICLKLTCGRVNPLRKPVHDTPHRNGETHVLYPNGYVSHGWVNQSSSTRNNTGGGCHGKHSDACH